jgi:glycosyltransferase involved in cell wall biosynthesis
MKIALLTDGIFPYVIGGMQRHSFYLAKYLAAAGHQVDLYHTNQSSLDIDKLDVFSGEEKKNIRSFVIPFPKMGSGPGHYLRESYEYSRLIWEKFSAQEPVDFIYAKGFAGWETLNKKRGGKKLPPFGVNFHGFEMFQPAPDFRTALQFRLLLRSPVRFHAKHADVLFSYGGKITTIIRSLGVPDERIIEIPTGISADWLNPKLSASGKVRRIVFVGRWERRKGVPELNKAITQLLSRGETNAEFNFVGNIPPKHQLKSDYVVYHGPVSDTEKLRALLRGMDILVCPSHSEGMPNVIMEGLASGLAVIATDVGAVSIMVNDKNGWLIPPADVNALTKALQQAVREDEKKLNLMRASAVATVKQNFLWTHIISLTENAIGTFVQSADK